MAGWKFKNIDIDNQKGNIFKTNGYLTLDTTNGLCVVNPDPKCCPCNNGNDCQLEYNVSFELNQLKYPLDSVTGDTEQEIIKSAVFKNCNYEMLVMWFNDSGSNSSYTKVLDSGNTNYFSVKNVDECLKLVFNNTPNKLIFNNGDTDLEEFFKPTYIDIGYPKIYNFSVNAQTHRFDCSNNIKYSGKINGHKIKYKPTTSAITSNCLTNCADLVELYFPCYGGDDSNLTTKLIGGGAFSGNTRLSAITLNSVTAVTSGAFSGCSSLKNIDWGHCGCSTPSSIRRIGENVFANCGMTDLDIPSSVENIGNGAFSGCTNLSAVTFNWKSLDNVNIAKSAFQNSHTITFYVPNGTANIYRDKFGSFLSNIEELEEITS
jgi:hypothetical protein